MYIHLILTVNKPNNDPDKGCIDIYSRFYQLFALEYFLKFFQAHCIILIMYKAMLGFILQGYVNRIGVHTQNSSFLELGLHCC